MNFSILNIILIVFFLLALYHGYRKGFLASVIYWAGLIVTTILILRYAPMVKIGLMNKFPIGAFFASCISYLLIIVLIAILANLLTILLNQVATMLSLNFLNRSIGALFGFLNAIIILIIVLTILEFLPYTKPVQAWLGKSFIIQETQKIKNGLKPKLITQYKKQNFDKK